MKRYSAEIKEQIIKESIETGSVSLVSKKHGVPNSTIQTWLRFRNNCDSKENIKEDRGLRGKILDLELENQILKELLKKTNQIWLKG